MGQWPRNGPGLGSKTCIFQGFSKIYNIKCTFSIAFSPRVAAIYNVNSTFSLVSSTVFGEPFEAIYIVNSTFSILFLPPFHIPYTVNCFFLDSQWPLWIPKRLLLASRWPFLASKGVLSYNFCLLGGVFWGPPLVWPPSFKTVLGPHKEFGPKLGAVILENLGSKTCILQVLAVFGFKMFLFKLPSGHFELPHGHL